MKLPYFIFMVTILYVTSAYRLEAVDRDFQDFELEKPVALVNALCLGNDCLHHRQRRWIDTLIRIATTAWKGAKITLSLSNKALTITSFALTIANLASDGCVSYPSICENTEKIKQLEKECLDLAKQLKDKYDNSTQDYDLLRDIVLNNIKINYTLEGIIDQVEETFNLSVEVDKILSKNISEAALLRDHTAEEIVNILVAPVEFRLQAIKDMVNTLKQQSGEGLGYSIAIQMGIEATISGLLKFRSLYKQTAQVAGVSSSVQQRLKLTFATFGENTKAFFGNFKTNVKSITTNNLNAFRTKITNPRGAVKSFVTGISLANTFINTIGAASGAVFLYITNKQWGEVNKAVQQSLQNYTDYKMNLQNQLNLAQEQTESITEIKDEAIYTFNDVVTSLAEGFKKTTYNHTSLFQQLGSNLLPENIALLLQENTATQNNVLDKQSSILTVLRDSKFQLENFYGWVRALNIVVKSSTDGVENEMSVSEILRKMQLAFEFQDDKTKQFSSLASINTLVCLLTITKPTENSYRTYPLSTIRNDCSQGLLTSFPSSYVNEHEKLALNFMVNSEIAKQKAAQADTSVHICSPDWYSPKCVGSVNDVHSTVNTFLSSDPLLKDKPAKPIKDVVEAISTLLPSETSFAFFDLGAYRNTTVITDALIQNLLFDAEDRKADCEAEARREKRRQCT